MIYDTVMLACSKLVDNGNVLEIINNRGKINYHKNNELKNGYFENTRNYLMVNILLFQKWKKGI